MQNVLGETGQAIVAQIQIPQVLERNGNTSGAVLPKQQRTMAAGREVIVGHVEDLQMRSRVPELDAGERGDLIARNVDRLYVG